MEETVMPQWTLEKQTNMESDLSILLPLNNSIRLMNSNWIKYLAIPLNRDRVLFQVILQNIWLAATSAEKPWIARATFSIWTMSSTIPSSAPNRPWQLVSQTTSRKSQPTIPSPPTAALISDRNSLHHPPTLTLKTSSTMPSSRNSCKTLTSLTSLLLPRESEKQRLPLNKAHAWTKKWANHLNLLKNKEEGKIKNKSISFWMNISRIQTGPEHSWKS